MTEAVYEKIGCNTHLLTVRGHAAGSPETCAAISGIVYALAGYLANAKEAGFALPKMRRMNSGTVALRYDGDRQGRVEAAYQMAVIGLKQLEQARPELVKVIVMDGKNSHSKKF